MVSRRDQIRAPLDWMCFVSSTAQGVKHSFVPVCDWMTTAMVGVHGEDALKAGGMAAGMRLRVRNNSPPSRKWFWDSACNMCRALVQGGMCYDDGGGGDVDADVDDGVDAAGSGAVAGAGGGDDKGGDGEKIGGGYGQTVGGGGGGSDDGGGRATSDGGGGSIEGCCARAYVAPHVQSAFSVWQKNPRAMTFLELWRDLALDASHDPGDDEHILSALAATLDLAVPYARYDTPYTGPINNDAKDPNLLLQPFAEGNPLPWLTPTEAYPECDTGEGGPEGDDLDVWTAGAHGTHKRSAPVHTFYSSSV